ncbi:MAG: heme exporter protein CcmB [Rhodospirillaceae bacterium TMED8]|nr:heme exporter protein CcmB [Magnetovibrio sp.]OUT52162.1 MAG: heme exporter protein CcmB [Rhodospirillaceae bacterium TMED8]
MTTFIEIVRRDLRLSMRHGMDTIMVVMFFVLVILLLPLGVGPEPTVLARISGGMIWVSALLASMLSVERLFQTDYEDGSLELLVIQPFMLELTVTAKVISHWLITGLPLLIIAPLLAGMLHTGKDGFAALLLTLAVGTPLLSLIGSIGAALILGARQGSILLSLLVLPLYIPILIFGVSAVDAAIHGLPWRLPVLILGSLLIGLAPFSVWATAAALRETMRR